VRRRDRDAVRRRRRIVGPAMIVGLHLIALAGFAAAMAAAAIEDLRRLVIPNPLVLALCALWLVHLGTAADASWAGALSAVGGAATVFLGGAVLFARGVIGGGDVKLFSAAALWVGIEGLAPLFALTGLIGGVLALVLLTPVGARFGARHRADAAGAADRTPVPYGVAIASAALIVTIPRYLL
jgi:prepilin peptidase CpaA